jgi:arylsulfatase A-like enzyme
VILVLAACGSKFSAPDSESPERDHSRPNIVFLLVDDLGWMDTAAYGSQYYETPNIDQLARDGMLFTDAYAAHPLCTPTRASIIAGQHPARLRMLKPSGHKATVTEEPGINKSAKPIRKVVVPRSRTQLPLDVVSLAEAVKTVGYHTGFIGKWHLGREPYWPREQGFDVQIAGTEQAGPPSYFSPYGVKNLEPGPDGEYITDRLTDETIKYLRQHKDQRFMLHLWYFGVHWPFGAKEELVERYRDKVDPTGRQQNPHMAGMIQSIDESVGRVRAELDSLGLSDNTVVIFTSDNGGNMYNRVAGHVATNNAPLRGGKGNIEEGGVRVPLIVSWPDAAAAGSRSTEIVQSIDFYPTILEMIGADKPADHRLDGVSFVSALRGGRLDRDTIFSYAPGYSSFRYPAASVRHGEYKLIRFFHDGPDWTHRYELYHVEDDIGETTNLAGELPGKVDELDQLIDEFLSDTNALLPFPNPNYDQSLPPDEFEYKDVPGQTRASEARIE